MNIPLLKAVQQRILRSPNNFDMGTWRWTSQCDVTQCGTTQCIGGWAVTLSPESSSVKPMMADNEWMSLAKRALDLTAEQAVTLFHASMWGEKFYPQYKHAQHQGLRHNAAQIAVERIQHFIDTDGKE